MPRYGGRLWRKARPKTAGFFDEQKLRRIARHARVKSDSFVGSGPCLPLIADQKHERLGNRPDSTPVRRRLLGYFTTLGISTSHGVKASPLSALARATRSAK